MGSFISFLGVKRPRRGVDHPPTSSVQVKGKRRAIPLFPLWVFTACTREKFTFFAFPLPNQEYQNLTPNCVQQFIVISNNPVDTFIFLSNTHFFVDKKNQLDATFCILYFSSNSCSTCFGQPCAHHQELTTA